MASDAAKAAHRGDGGDLREELSGRAVNPEIHQDDSWPQDRLVAVQIKNSRSRFEGRLQTRDGKRRLVLTVRDQDGLGAYKNAGPQITWRPDQMGALIDLIHDLRRAAVEEGLL